MIRASVFAAAQEAPTTPSHGFNERDDSEAASEGASRVRPAERLPRRRAGQDHRGRRLRKSLVPPAGTEYHGATPGPPDPPRWAEITKATTSWKRLRQTGSSRCVSAGLSSGPNFESVRGGSTPPGAIPTVSKAAAAPYGRRSSSLYLSAGRSEPEPSFFAARFSLRRSLSVFCGFCFCCFFGLSELLLMGSAGR